MSFLPLGGNQLQNFSKALRSARLGRDITEILAARGYTYQDIGVHSLRKGAGTFALNGIVGVSASVSAVCLRAGWTQGAIKDKYLKYEGAADTYLGRILAGYPLTGPNAVKFGTLPPIWGENVTNPDVQHALKIAFPVVCDENFQTQSRGFFLRM